MSLSQVASARFPRLVRKLRGWAAAWNRIGEQMAFYVKVIGQIRVSLTRYKTETLRVLAQMALGVGELAAIGGTVTVLTFLLLNVGGIVAVISHAELGGYLGLDALAGFFSAFANTRLPGPVIAVVGLSATVGASATAELGAMRINEEIDALEVMGINAVAYLASTRVFGGVIAVVPIFWMALMGAYLACRFVLVGFYGQSSGVYDHYFNTFLAPLDVVWSTLGVAAAATIVMLIHTYYGLTASGGPAGVGEATGRAVRASLVVANFTALAVSLGAYGYSGNFHLSA